MALLGLFVNKNQQAIEELKLAELKERVESFEYTDMTSLVDFFKLILGYSDIQLKALSESQFTDLYRILAKYQRDSCGFCRAPSLCDPTDENVFAGNIFGFWTHPVSHWMSKKSEPKGGLGLEGFPGKNVYDVISVHQVIPYLNEAITEILEALNQILS